MHRLHLGSSEGSPPGPYSALDGTIAIAAHERLGPYAAWTEQLQLQLTNAVGAYLIPFVVCVHRTALEEFRRAEARQPVGLRGAEVGAATGNGSASERLFRCALAAVRQRRPAAGLASLDKQRLHRALLSHAAALVVPASRRW